MLAAVKQGGYALKYASKNLRRDREIVLAAELNGYTSNKYLIAEDIRNVYSNPQKLLEQISVIEETYDPLILLCHFDGQDSHEKKFDFLKVLLQKGDLIPHLAQRVECIQNTLSIQREACTNALSRSPDDDVLTKQLTALNKYYSDIDAVFLNYQAYLDPSAKDTALSLLELPADAEEKAIIEAFSTQDYNALKQKIDTQKLLSSRLVPGTGEDEDIEPMSKPRR